MKIIHITPEKGMSAGFWREGLPGFKPILMRMEHEPCLRSISSVYEAANFLVEEWPVVPNPSFRLATNTCRDVLSGMSPVAKARLAFIKAAQEAGIEILPKGNGQVEPGRKTSLCQETSGETGRLASR